MDFSKVPTSATLDVKPFKAHVDEEKLQHFKELLKLSSIGPAVFENTNAGRRYGTQRDWLANAKKFWLEEFDWRKHEDRINSFPNFTASVRDDDGTTTDIHFLALFSEKPDAIPIAFFHGWPGSFLEFLDLVDILRKRHTPKDLPYHVIVPSLPGYAYSSGPPLDKDYTSEEMTSVLNKLLVGLGFGSGYIAQGGDIGSGVSRRLAGGYDACKAIHINMLGVPPPENKDELPVDELEQKVLLRGQEFMNTGVAYAQEQGQRTATLGLALSASPLAMLSWIGEKFLEWSDEDPPLDKILEGVTLYWMTDTFPRCIYPYRGNGSSDKKPRIAETKFFGGQNRPQIPYIDKPTGYSLFPYDIILSPKSWAATVCNLIYYSQHQQGGHFAALERPADLLADVEEFVKKAWKS